MTASDKDKTLGPGQLNFKGISNQANSTQKQRAMGGRHAKRCLSSCRQCDERSRSDQIRSDQTQSDLIRLTVMYASVTPLELALSK